MNVQLYVTDEMREMPVDMLNLTDRFNNLFKRCGHTTVGEVIDNWYKYQNIKGVGVTIVRGIQNAVINMMISKMTDDQLVEWFKYLLENNTPEQLRSVIEGFDQIVDAA